MAGMTDDHTRTAHDRTEGILQFGKRTVCARAACADAALLQFAHLINHFFDAVARHIAHEGLGIARILINAFGRGHDQQHTRGEKTGDDRRRFIIIHSFDDRMSTGFVGTPYILHVLSENGKTDLAYKLLFQDQNPSWLYSVDHGATTMWEHWNGIKEDGSFWSDDMNSFNHYAYGAVADWLYGVCAGISVCEDGAGYKHFLICPHPDERLGFVNCSLDTENGKIESNWYYKNDRECILNFQCRREVLPP